MKENAPDMQEIDVDSEEIDSDMQEIDFDIKEIDSYTDAISSDTDAISVYIREIGFDSKEIEFDIAEIVFDTGETEFDIKALVKLVVILPDYHLANISLYKKPIIMIRRNLNYLHMVNATLSVLNKNTAVWQGSAPCTRQVTAVQTAYDNTGAAQQGADVVVTGVSDDKHAAAEDAIHKAVELAGYTKAYAAENEDHTLYRQMDVSFSALDKLADEALAPRLTDLLSRMQKIGNPLVEYGVTTAKLTALDAAITKFTGLNAAPRTAIVERKGSNENIPQLLRTMRKALDILDDLVPQFKDDHAAFVQDYFNARVIVDLGGHHAQKKADVTA